MRCQAPKVAVVLLCVAATLAGCAPQQPLYLRNNGDLSHYIGMSQTIDNADVPEPPFSEVEGTIRPFSIDRPAPTDIGSLKLEDAIRTALQNGKVMRSLAGVGQGPLKDRDGGPPTFLTANPAERPRSTTRRSWKPMRVSASTPAMSLFDPQWNTDLFWERNHEPRNVNPIFASSCRWN